MSEDSALQVEGVPRQTLDVDIACVGFGPANAGFLTTLSRRLADASRPPLEKTMITPKAARMVAK